MVLSCTVAIAMPIADSVVPSLRSSELRFHALTSLSFCEINSEIIKQVKVSTLPSGVSHKLHEVASL